jgi:quinol monooxygenase YgiN
MYLVISEWEPLPGKEAEFERAGSAVAAVLRRQPGVLLLEMFRSGSKHVAVHGYQDEATYHALVDDPNGAFARAQVSHRVEGVARWLGSQGGETLTHENPS